MTRDYDIESILGVPFEETPETLAYDLSAQFSSQVSQRLDEAGMTLKELSEKMGVAQPSLCKMLGPKSNMTMKTVAKIALALDCDVAAPELRGKRETEGDPEEASQTIGGCKVLNIRDLQEKRAKISVALTTAKEG